LSFVFGGSRREAERERERERDERDYEVITGVGVIIACG
jgi:hypothetical protein